MQEKVKSEPVHADFANDHDNQIDNKSANRRFDEVLRANVSRRTVMQGGIALAATGFLPKSAEATDSYGHYYAKRFPKPRGALIDFTAVPVADGNGPTPTVAKEYQYDVLIPWGEPIEPGGPAYQYPPTAEDQAEQIGIGHDGMWFFPKYRVRSNAHPALKRFASKRGMLVVNHEFGRNSHVLGKSDPESIADVRTSQHAHGVSVVEVVNRRGKWTTVRSKNARRIHVNTPVVFSGPVKNSPLLQTPNGNIPLGTVNNCANGYTPWGTYLTCEENFNGYFGASNRENTWVATPEQERYGFSDSGFSYGWHLFDRRFDLSDVDYQNEENRFGWVVEIDPNDATQKPVKRTALGRFKHEGVALVSGKGRRAVAYMGDDQRFDYIYKFVSADDWKVMRRKGISPLDEGKLYVARFNEDNTGDWLELTIDNPLLAERFSSQEEVLVYARVAADLLGATPMDRPEWITVAPNSDVYCTLTNNSRRTEPNAANPLVPNNDGHIIKWRDADKHTGLTFDWEIFLIAEETHGTEDSYSDPDGLWADPDGRLFIQTDGGQKDGLNNQMLVADTKTKEIRRLLTGVTSDEITGIAVTPDQRTMFVNIQHPGNGDPSLTNFPAPTDGVTVPRDATLVITRKDGGVIGS
ncbi:MAG: PhoX family phosphatase [Acidiferrobacterales bacterium]|nr:PhoX family phosphatase [Acidiferrobacterales bacterium]